MKRTVTLLLAAVMLLLLPACGKAGTTVPQSTPAAAPTTIPAIAPTSIPAATSVPAVTPAPTAVPITPSPMDYYACYNSVIALYSQAICEEWDIGTCWDNGVNYLVGMTSDKSSLGYCFHDIDGDIVPELFIGAIGSPEIYAMYTLDLNLAPVQVVDAGERSSYYLEPDCAIVNRCSNSAFQSGYRILMFKDKTMKLHCAMIADYNVDQNNPWTLAHDDDWEQSNDERITNERAEKAIKAYEDNFVYLPYIQF